MRVDLKDFQVDAVGELADKLAAAQALVSTGNAAAVLLNAPTGSGKTLMMTALIDLLLGGGDSGFEADPDYVFLWLTDDPELNRQSAQKMLATSSVLTAFDVLPVDASVNSETFSPGKVYLLNTQKLGSGTSYVKIGDGRNYTLWDMVNNTVAVSPARFVLVIDEAHRGARGKDAAEAETIMQKFMIGADEVNMVPLVVGVSATPGRFTKLCNETNRPVLKVEVPPELVRESGLLKEFVDLYHPDEAQPNHATMLTEAVAAWQEYVTRWEDYGKSQGEAAPEPLLLIQVEDAKATSGKVSETDLGMVVRVLLDKMDHADDRWIAHAFQDNAELMIEGVRVRHLAPSKIDSDQYVKVVLFKSSLNTGWDCPRAETMVSFRSANDDVGIAQLVGRMVRAPLARRIDDDEHLNTVALYLPYYNSDEVRKVVERLTGDPDIVPPTRVREGKARVTVARAAGTDECFEALEKLPTYTIPRARSSKPIARLGKLAAVLRDLKLEADPVKGYRSELVEVLAAERNRLQKAADFQKLANEASLLDLRRQRIALASKNKGQELTTTVRATIAEPDLDLLHADSGRVLGEGLHKEYLRRRVKVDKADARTAKIELAALIQMPGVLDKVIAAADAKRLTWIDDHKVAINSAGDKWRQQLREIEGSGSDPALVSIAMPSTIEGSKSPTSWKGHLYVDESTGEYPADFTSSWERRTLEAECKREGFVAWFRNPDRKPYSVCAPRRDGTGWRGIYPDFVFFRNTKSGIIADIVDPHMLAEKDAPARAAALADYASKHGDVFGRIEMVIFDSDKDTTGKRLDLMDKTLRDRVARVTTHAHLKDLFESLG